MNGRRYPSHASSGSLPAADGLTGLPTYSALAMWLEKEAAHGGAVSLVCLDVDRLAELNRAAGTGAGDSLLRELSALVFARTVELARTTPGRARVARLGTDELAVLLPGYGKEEARLWSETLRDEIEGHRFGGGHRCSVTAGVAAFPGDADSHVDLLEAARAALRHGKKGGRNCVVAYEAEADPASRDPARLLRGLLGAPAEDVLSYVYQPIVRASDGVVVACEALCRPRGSRFEGPSRLFADAADRDLVWELGRVTRRLAVAPLHEREDTVDLFINVHPHELQDPALLDPPAELRAVASRVVLEVGEGARFVSIEHTRRCVERLHAQGFRVALDDVGAGYAGLRSLAELDLDFVKLDRALVRGSVSSSPIRRLVEQIAVYARHRGIRLVAEGIETEEERTVVEEVGADLLQGYLFGRGESLVPTAAEVAP